MALTEKIVMLLTVILLLLGNCPELRAEEREEEEATEEKLLFMEVPIVVTASRMEQPVTEAPSSISIVTSDEIKKYGYRNFADVLRSVRGFYITYDRNYHYVGVRGFNRPGDYNTRILLLVDGHRINDNIYDQAFIGTDFPVDVDLIDRVEIIRGPGSSLYGSNAFFAVINVITRRGPDFKGAEASGEAGSFATYKTRLTYGNKFRDDIEAVLSGSYYDSRGNSRLYYREFDVPSAHDGVAEGLDYDRFGSLFGEVVLQDFTLQSAYLSRKKGVPTASYSTVFNDDRSFTIDERYYIDLKYAHVFAGEFGVMARLTYDGYSYQGDYPTNYAAPGEPTDIVVNKDYSSGKWWGGEVQITKKLCERHRFIMGGEFRDNFQQDQKNYDREVYLDDKRKSRVWAFYAQDEFTILRNLILNAGVRYDHSSTFGSTTNPRLALIYNPFEKTTFKLLYGTAFRAPNAYEFYYQVSDSAKLNPDLKPEIIKTYELIFEQYIGNNLRGTASAFFYKIGDLITLTTDPFDNLLVFKNIGEVEAKGLEFELEGKWESGLTGRISYTFQEAEDKQTGQTLTNSPQHLAKINLIYPLLKDRVFAGFEEQYTSRRKTLEGDFAKASYLTNITLFSKNLVKNLEASVSFYNLFNYRYGDPGSEEHVQDIIAQDGRSFRIKLTYRF